MKPMPEKLILFDYSGTLSLEAPLFGRSENITCLLEETGLASLGITSPEIFWSEIVNPTWVAGSTTSIGYGRVMAARIAALRLAPDTPKSQIEAATSRFVAAYLAHSRIDSRWRPLLSRLNEQATIMTVVATDHYAEATGAITDYLNAWGIAFPDASRFFVANSADVGFWKTDRRFWEILKSQLPLTAVRGVILIDDFGFNEASGDNYEKRAIVLARQEKTIAHLKETFQAAVEVIPFHLPMEGQEREETCARLITQTTAHINEFLEREK
jgi:hypothetical protein